MQYINATEPPRKSGIRDQTFVTVTGASMLFPPNSVVLPKS